VPFFLKLFDRQAIRKSQEENAHVVLSGKLDKQTQILLSNELGFVVAVALILS
jgi:hypothetical protein